MDTMRLCAQCHTPLPADVPAALGRVVPLSKDDIANFASTFKRGSHISKLWTYYVEGGRASGLLPEEWELL